MSVMMDLTSRSKLKELAYVDLIRELDVLMTQKPCALVRVLFENGIVTIKDNKEHLFDAEIFEEFMQRHVFTLHPFIINHCDDNMWTDFFYKYLLMIKE